MPQRRRSVPLRALSVGALAAGLLLTSVPAAGAVAPRGLLGGPSTAAPAASVTSVAAAPRHVPTSEIVTSRGRAAMRWAKNRSSYPTRRCVVFVRSALRVPPRYATPRIAFANARKRHHSRYSKIPAGVPVYSAGRTAPGHIVLSLGNGMVRSTDWPRPGRVGTVSLAKLLRTWNHRYLGWTEDLNGVRVWHR